ncbi:MAG: 16S rRNA (adenine(1518)-N(6)/adenine(1519)-N(6))-dimethyltransferase RsmA [Pseudomonadota bacterium]
MHRPRKRFGQNFLVDPNTIEDLIKAINPKPTDHIIEIGPGLGALTKPLLEKLDSLEVIEIDRDLISKLEHFKSQGNPLTIHKSDALKYDFSCSESPRRIVGNLPYNISTPLIFHLLGYLDSILDMHFMLQKEVVERICARSGEKNFGRLSVMVQAKCNTTNLFEIDPDKFDPPPKVTSAFIRIKANEQQIISKEMELRFSEVVRSAFSQPRKTLANNLKTQFSHSQIEKLGIDPSIRPQNIQIEELVKLAQQ